MRGKQEVALTYTSSPLWSLTNKQTSASSKLCRGCCSGLHANSQSAGWALGRAGPAWPLAYYILRLHKEQEHLQFDRLVLAGSLWLS